MATSNVICGPIVITAADESTGETYRLTDAEVALCRLAVARWTMFAFETEGQPS
jgi:hypothetical protein